MFSGQTCPIYSWLRSLCLQNMLVLFSINGISTIPVYSKQYQQALGCLQTRTTRTDVGFGTQTLQSKRLPRVQFWQTFLAQNRVQLRTETYSIIMQKLVETGLEIPLQEAEHTADFWFIPHHTMHHKGSFRDRILSALSFMVLHLSLFCLSSGFMKSVWL